MVSPTAPRPLVQRDRAGEDSVEVSGRAEGVEAWWFPDLVPLESRPVDLSL